MKIAFVWMLSVVMIPQFGMFSGKQQRAKSMVIRTGTRAPLYSFCGGKRLYTSSVDDLQLWRNQEDAYNTLNNLNIKIHHQYGLFLEKEDPLEALIYITGIREHRREAFYVFHAYLKSLNALRQWGYCKGEKYSCCLLNAAQDYRNESCSHISKESMPLITPQLLNDAYKTNEGVWRSSMRTCLVKERMALHKDFLKKHSPESINKRDDLVTAYLCFCHN